MFLAAAAIIAQASNTTTIPVDDISGLIVVSAMVNGKGPFHFALDTGSSTVVITPAFALEIAVPTGEPEVVNGSSAQREVAIKTDLADFAIAGVRQSHVEATVLPMPPFITDQGSYGTIDGLIGYSFLKHYALSIDLSGGRIALTPRADFTAPAGAFSLPMEVAASGTPVIEAALDGVGGRFAIDTGTKTAVALTSTFVDAHSIHARNAIESWSKGIGGSIRTARTRFAVMTLGTATLHNVLAELLRSQSASLQGVSGVIGYGALRQFTVTLDYAGRRAYFKPSAQFDTYQPFVGTGIERDRNADGMVTVVGTVPGSPAARAGIRSGDTILAIDGRSVMQMSNAEYEATAGTSPGASAVYTLRSGNMERELTLKTVDLLLPVWIK